MATHLSIGRIPTIPLLALLGLAVTAGTAHYLSRSDPGMEMAGAARIAPSAGVARVSDIEVDGAEALPERVAGTAIARDPEPAQSAAPTLNPTGADAPVQNSVPLAAAPPAIPELLEPERLAAEPAAIPAAIAMALPTAEAAVAAEVELPTAAAPLTLPTAPARTPRPTPLTAPVMAVQAVAPQERVTVARLTIEPQESPARRDIAAPATRSRKLAPIPLRAPRATKSASISAGGAAALAAQATAQAGARSAAQISAKVDNSAARLFQNGAKIRLKKDASVYLTSRNVPENDHLLQAYSAGQTNGGWVQTRAAAAVPGLLGIAVQAQRAQRGDQGKAVYSLADAMRDAIWRKNTAERLKSLTTAQNTCGEGVDDVVKTAPSIGLISSC